ncbi:MAG: DUF1559 domain-containing protein [Planctomycetaceae bacterium]|nr:DUF1559 domain-containing protein [Planctomycetaceae bacterium]
MSHPYPPSLNDAGDWSFTTGSGVLTITIGLLLLTLLRKRNAAGLHVLIAGCSFLSLTAWYDWPAADVRGSYYSRTSLLDLWLLRGAVTLTLITNTRTLQLWSRQNSNAAWYQVLAIYGLAFLATISQATLCPPEAPWRTQCRNNLKQLGLSLQNYHDVWAEFPPLAAGTPPVSWRVQLLPYIEQEDLHRAYDVTSAWNSATSP